MTGGGGFVEFIRASREVHRALVIRDPLPVKDVKSVWTSTSQAALIGIFLLLFSAFLYVGRTILLPIVAAAIVGLTLAPLVKAGKKSGISPWITGLLIVAFGVGALSLGASAMAGPLSEWIHRAPEIEAVVKERLSVLDQPLASLRELQTAIFGGGATLVTNASTPSMVFPVVAFITPAAGELLLFFGTLMFLLVGQIDLRNNAVSLFGDRDAKLRFLKIMRDIERNLVGYLTVVTIINVMLGLMVTLGTWLIGLPNPIIFGLLAALLNYVPYVGPAVMVLLLFGVSLVTFTSFGQAFIAPIGLIALTTTEGHFVTPTIIGRHLTLNPLLVFLALAFWTWIWGPFGAFLAVPLSIIGLVIFNHLFATEDIKLPD
jgi:predicted PurR-regulated permease PerM